MPSRRSRWSASAPTASRRSKAVAQLQPDLLLLDIQMRSSTVSECWNCWSRRPAVVRDAHDEHALRAFQVHAVDYLLKPVTATRLTAALQRSGPARRGPRRRGGGSAPGSRSAGGGYLEGSQPPAPARPCMSSPVERLDYAEAGRFRGPVAGGVPTASSRRSTSSKTCSTRAFVRHTPFLPLKRRAPGAVELTPRTAWWLSSADGTKSPSAGRGTAAAGVAVGAAYSSRADAQFPDFQRPRALLTAAALITCSPGCGRHHRIFGPCCSVCSWPCGVAAGGLVGAAGRADSSGDR